AIGIETARDVQAYPATVVHLRSAQVREISAEFHARPGKRAQRFVRITYSVHRKFVISQSRCGSDQEFLQLPRPLFVTPVADPDYVCIFGCVVRKKICGVSGFVEGPDSFYAERFKIDFADRLAKSQDAVEFSQRKAQDLSWVGVRAVMRVMKQSAKSKLLLQRKNSRYH